MERMSIKEVTKVIQSVGTGNSFNVTFVKKDGTERTFFGCTLEGKPEGSTQGELPQALPVKIIEDGVAKWRSFRVDSVTQLEVN